MLGGGQQQAKDMHQRQRTAAEILVDQLLVQGVELAFAVPGESYLPVLDALHDRPGVRLVVARQEGGAAMMAEAHGKLTGRPGICFVTRGPGATNASAGVHVAFQDSTPLIVFIGQVARDVRQRGAFQEMDYGRFFASITKAVLDIDAPHRTAEIVARAFRLAISGRPGPVVVVLPEDVLAETAESVDAPRVTAPTAAPSAGDLDHLKRLLATAERPLVVVGEGGWSAAASEHLAAVAAAHELPVCASFRCQDYLDNEHGCFAGTLSLGADPRLVTRFANADLIITISARLGEVASQDYSLLAIPRPSQTVVQIEPGAEEIGKVFQPALAIQATPATALAAMRDLPATPNAARHAWRKAARQDYVDFRDAPLPAADPPLAGVDPAAVVAHLRTCLPPDAIVCNGAGNYATWVHRLHRYRSYRSQLAPICGAMGYGLPAAIAAKLAYPQRTVVCFAGDGCLQMTVQELGTAMQEHLAIKVLVVNNSSYGTIRMHQERRYPGRVSGTRLQNPDFAALARSYGALGETVRDNAAFAAALARALANDGPALLDLIVDTRAVSPGRVLPAA